MKIIFFTKKIRSQWRKEQNDIKNKAWNQYKENFYDICKVDEKEYKYELKVENQNYDVYLFPYWNCSCSTFLFSGTFCIHLYYCLIYFLQPTLPEKKEFDELIQESLKIFKNYPVEDENMKLPLFNSLIFFFLYLCECV